MRRLRNSLPVNALRWCFNFRGQRSGIGRGYLFDALSRFTPSIAVDTDGLRLYVNTRDKEVSRHTFIAGAYERVLLARAMQELRKAGICGDDLEGRGFLDIGSNIGSATCLSLIQHGAGESWAFEPAPGNLGLLRQNVLANGLTDRVHIHPVALSDEDGTVTLELSATNFGDHRVRVERPNGGAHPALLEEDRRSTFDVQARRLDSLVEEGSIDLGSLGLVWIDVQGHEGHVFAGATKLLASDVPIVCEYWPYGLERAGGLERFDSLVAEARSRFIDLATPSAPVLPTKRLSALRGQYAGLTYTDLLLLR